MKILKSAQNSAPKNTHVDLCHKFKKNEYTHFTCLFDFICIFRLNIHRQQHCHYSFHLKTYLYHIGFLRKYLSTVLFVFYFF